MKRCGRLDGGVFDSRVLPTVKKPRGGQPREGPPAAQMKKLD
jgi:hypothetical protein